MPIFIFYGIKVALVDAETAECATLGVNGVFLVWQKWDGICRTAPGALGATDAVVGDSEGNHVLARTSATNALHMFFVFVPEMAQSGQNGVGSRLSQSAERGFLHMVGQLLEQVDVLHRSLAGREFVEDVEHSPCPDAGRCICHNSPPQ